MKTYTLPLSLLFCIISYKNFATNFTLESTAFKPNSIIPVEYTCNGADQSPPLTWHDAPTNTQSFALVVEDPDAPNGIWTHWILFNIPTTVAKLDVGSPIPEGASSSKNSWNTTNYRGPCPPIGMHRYFFKLYAVDKVLSLENNPTKDAVLQAMTGHVIGSSELVGLYQK